MFNLINSLFKAFQMVLLEYHHYTINQNQSPKQTCMANHCRTVSVYPRICLCTRKTPRSNVQRRYHNNETATVSSCDSAPNVLCSFLGNRITAKAHHHTPAHARLYQQLQAEIHNNRRNAPLSVANYPPSIRFGDRRRHFQ